MDKDEFRTLFTERYRDAAGVAMPEPDPDAPDDQRERLHREATERASKNRDDAIKAVTAHAASVMVADAVHDLWVPGVTEDGFDLGKLTNDAQDLIAKGDGESLARAAALLSIAAFSKQVKGG
jgi:hypothetical protein